MSKPNTRKGRIPKHLYYPKGQLIANLSFLREYLGHYLEMPSHRVVIRGDQKIYTLHERLSSIRYFAWKELELSLLAFDPFLCQPPKVILSADMENWPGIISSGALRNTRESMERQFPFFALQLSVKGAKKPEVKFLEGLQSKVFLWISEANRKQLSGELLQDAVLFSELYFDQQIREVCKLYGASLAFCPSLQ
jgi:hypothetical protein